MKLKINGVILESDNKQEIDQMLKAVIRGREPLAAGVHETTRQRWTDEELAYLRTNQNWPILKLKRGLYQQFKKSRTDKAIRIAVIRLKKAN